MNQSKEKPTLHEISKLLLTIKEARVVYTGPMVISDFIFLLSSDGPRTKYNKSF